MMTRMSEADYYWNVTSKRIDTDKWWPTRDRAWRAFLNLCKKKRLATPLHMPGKVSGDGTEVFKDGDIRILGVRDGHGNVFLEGRPRNEIAESQRGIDPPSTMS